MTATVGLAPVTAARCSVRVLGTFDLVVDGISHFVGDAGTTLIALLAVTSGRSRDEVQATMWPDCATAQASSRLRSLLYRIRQLTGDDVVRAVGGGHALRLAPDIDVDFRRAAELMRAIGAEQRLRVGYDDVVDLLGRELLPSVQAEWTLPHKWAWSRARLGALVAYAHQRADADDWIGASAAAEAVLASEPFNEAAHYLVIESLLRDGFANSARQMFDALAGRLDAELDCAPRRSYDELLARARRDRS